MKSGTMYAVRLKKAYARLRQSVSKPEIPEPEDPLRQLGIAILGDACGDAPAIAALDRVFSHMVDWNEMRVSNPAEAHRAIGPAIPQGPERCHRLIRALQSIYDRENRLSLDRLKHVGRREAKQYLEQLDGTDEYVVAAVLLWSLGGHAIPVNEKLLRALREADLVNPTAERAEVQAFLERHISAAEAKEFCMIMRSFAGERQAAARRSKAKRTTKKKRRGSTSK